MLKKIEGFFFGQVFGRMVARAALAGVSGFAAWLAGKGIELTPDQQAAAVTAVVGAANSAYTKLSDWREKRAKSASAAASFEAAAKAIEAK